MHVSVTRRSPPSAACSWHRSLRPDGSLLINPGYDPVTELFLLDPPLMPPVPDSPSRVEGRRSVSGSCVSSSRNFPFGGNVNAEAVALSGADHAGRPRRPRTACHCTASRRRKPAAARAIWSIYLLDPVATGFLAPVISLGKDETELEKRLGTVLVSGHPIISYRQYQPTAARRFHLPDDRTRRG